MTVPSTDLTPDTDLVGGSRGGQGRATSEGPARTVPEAPETEGVPEGRRNAEVVAPEVEGGPAETGRHQV